MHTFDEDLDEKNALRFVKDIMTSCINATYDTSYQRGELIFTYMHFYIVPYSGVTALVYKPESNCYQVDLNCYRGYTVTELVPKEN